jgi:hypothetical protein
MVTNALLVSRYLFRTAPVTTAEAIASPAPGASGRQRLQ